jgi:glycerophosphoryl diester phosphodiesterase
MTPKVCAHRGFARLYPENTALSVRQALRLGARFVEIDVQLSSDLVPVVYHDPSLRRVSGRAGDLRRLPWSALKGLPAHEPGRFGDTFGRERICSLERLASALARNAAFKGARLFVELKEESLKPFGRLEMLAAVHAALKPIRKRCILISFDLEVLRLARALSSYPLGYVIRRWSDLKKPALAALRPEFIFSSTHMLPRRGSLKLPHARHCAYEVADPALGRSLWQRGLDLVETFALDHYR